VSNVLKILLEVIISLIIINLYAQHANAQEPFSLRISGNNRYDTAAAVSREGWQQSYYAVLASGEDFTGALCSGPLAEKFSSPVLLTEKKRLPAESMAELKRLGTKHVMIIGGPEAVDSSLDEALRLAGVERVERIFGQDRYETAVQIAMKLDAKGAAVLASGESPWDAAAMSTIAAYKELPILLTGRDFLPSSVEAYLQQKNNAKTYVIGGLGVISSYAEEKLLGCVRIGGRDRFETNKLILENFSNDLDFHHIFAVTGGDGSGFSDALSVSSLAGRSGYPLVMIQGEIPQATWDYLKTKAFLESRLVAIGGERAVPEAVCREFDRYVGNLTANPMQAGTDTRRGDASGSESAPPVSTVTAVASPNQDSAYKEGDIIEIKVTFSGGVEVTGIPGLRLETGQSDREAVYTSGTGTKILTFCYTVQAGDGSDDLDYTGTDALNLNGGTIIDKMNHQDAQLLLPAPGGPGSLSSISNLIIDTIPPNTITISSVNEIPGNGSVILTVENGPLADDSWTDILNEIKANVSPGGNWITGVSAGDLYITPSPEGDNAVLGNRNVLSAAITGDFVIPAGKVRDKAGNTALENASVDSCVRVNAVAVSSLTPDGFYKAGSAIPITITFDGEVSVTGTPALCLETGAIDRLAEYTGGSGSTQLSFNYSVQQGDTSPDLEYIRTNALTGIIKVKGKSINANLVLPLPGGAGSLGQAKNIVIDTVAPAAINISIQGSIPGHGQAVLTAVEGPLSNTSWTNILNRIKSNTINGNWIRAISSTHLTITISADGATAALNNNEAVPAVIMKDFVIPGAEVVDKAGNSAAEDITIQSFGS